ncbi:hypothetical protein AAFN85_24820 [Mucilaginibacter sp. CAU 1740]|uniref:hypothetical protein n=1 Tax=Mucilaginibacter sp. CAU 1740 TaxID=3140365 RepID=UPI00325A9895
MTHYIQAEDEIQFQVQRPKIYTVKSIRVATFLFGPLAAGYLVSQNYRAFDQRDKAAVTWVIAGVVLMVVILVVSLTINIERFPKFIIPLAYAWGTTLLVQNLQGQQINEHIATGGKTFTIWRALLAGLICLVATLLILYTIIIIVEPEALV